jgi:hypothetical protein
MGDNGFRSDLIKNSLESIKHEVTSLVSSFKFQTNILPVEEYKDDSSWMSFC